MTIPHSIKIPLFQFLETPKSGSDPDKLPLSLGTSIHNEHFANISSQLDKNSGRNSPIKVESEEE